MLTDPELRAAESRRYRAIVDQTNTPEGNPWAAVVPKLRAAWEEHLERYPERDRMVPGTRPDGSWGTDTDRMLTAERNAEATQVCEEIRHQGKEVIFPAMKRIEAADPQRYLAGLEHMLKGEDRLKEKAAERLRYHPDMTVGQAITEVPDAVRFTFAYSENRYTEGVRGDVERLKAEGFELIKLKNLWTKDQYKGINSQWRDRDSGLLIETQFHTRTSFEAKELTHQAYERIRTPATTKAEEVLLEDYQRLATARVPVPPGVFEIEDYPPEKRDG